MRIVIVEDEPVAARQLAKMIGGLLPDGVVALAPSVEAGADALREGADLLFLDLNLAGEDGFALLRRFVGEPFETIVTTAYPERAVEAFELGVRDYLVKPFSKERLAQALARVPSSGDRESPPLAGLMVKSREGYENVPVADIVAVRSAGDYTELLLDTGGVRLSAKRMEFLEQRLPADFMRVHRTAIVRLSKVKKLTVEPGGKYAVVVAGASEPLPVGRAKYREVKRRLAERR
jgi:DNA-binding LytR/AlgR family response regulator